MKRFILPLLLLLLISPVFSQNILSISGTVTDNITSQPIANHAVYISSDSTGGFVYYNTVYTNSNGYYNDSILLNPATDSGFMYISTYDCNNSYVSYPRSFGPSNMNLVQNFQICSGTSCQADFTYANTQPLTLQFSDISTGTTGPWLWQFGDGTSSSQQNPSHTFGAGGYYPVSLTIGDSATSCWDMTSQTVYVTDSTGNGCVAGFEAYPDSTGGYTVYFYDQSLGNILYWSWNFDDPASGMNNTSTIQNPTHTFSEAGTYLVCLTIQGVDSTCYDTYCMPVTVGNTPAECEADFYYFSDSNAVTNTYYFVDISSGNVNSWYWDFGDGTTSTEQNPTHLFTSPGFYTVCLTVQGVDSLCFDTYCDILNVGGGGGCQAQFTYFPDSNASASLIHFMDLSYGDITSWLWDFGDSTPVSTLQNPSHMFPEEGTYYVCLTITGNNSGAICQSTWCEEVTVGTGSGCASYFSHQNNGLSISFTGHMVNGQPATYLWDFGDGQSGQGQSILHQYASAGIYFVSLTTATQNPTGCTYSTAQSITVGDSTQWNQIYGQVFAGNFPLEYGMVMIFSLDTTANFLPFIDISMVDSSGIYYFPMVPLGQYMIYAIPFIPTGYLPTYYGDVLSWEAATVVSLGQANNPYNINLIEAFTFNTGGGGINGQINTTGIKGGLVDKITMLLMNESGETISFNQVDNEGAFDFSDLDYGIYYLKAEMVGCESDYIKVELTMENPIADVVMTLSGNNILGVNENTSTMEAGVVYPNPVSNIARISVKMSEGSQVTIELYNLSGQRVYQSVENLAHGSTEISVPVSQLRDGFYSLRIYTNSGMDLTRKLLKSR